MNYYNQVIQNDMKNLIKEKLNFSVMKDKKFLITGANGMIATYFIYFLMYLNDKMNMNIKIYALSRDIEKSKSRFLFNTVRKDINLISQDVCDKIDIHDKIDYIIHLASSANPDTILKNPISIIKANLFGTFNILELARYNNSEVIFSSTREIYGKVSEEINLIKETDMGVLNCFEQRACYPESKRMAETILFNFYKQYGVKFKNLRIAHSYGPGMNIENDGRIMSDLIQSIVNKHDIVLKSKGEAKRAFCYITDTISAILYTIINGKVAQSYNIANETEEITIKGLANLMADMYKNYNIKVKYEISNNPNAYTNFKRVGLDTTKIESLGWRPKVTLQQGIQKTVNSFWI